MRRLASRTLGAGLILLGILAATAVTAPLIARYDPTALVGAALESPSRSHLLGTNEVGQDVFAQLIWGARTSLSVAIGAAALALAIAVLVGVGSALVGGWVETLAMRLVDVVLAFPLLPLLVLVAALLGPHRGSLILLIGLMSWPGPARVLRSQTLSVRHRGFVRASRGFGGGIGYVLRRHLVPALGPLLVSGFVTVAGHAVLLEAGLAFLGLADPTGVSWGLMLNRALLQQGLYFSAEWPWWVLPAGLAITVTILGFTFVGVGIEATFNVRLRRTA
ncbi:MAG: ABC transporter permease [Candidatus Dormibacteria bacterium]